MMEMTPCDIFAYIRGRTVWLVGDSMMQVRCNSSNTYPPTEHTCFKPAQLLQTLYRACIDLHDTQDISLA